MNPEKNPLPVETPLARKIIAAVEAWQQQVPAAATLAECEAGAQQLAQHLAQLALTEQLATRQAASGTEKSLPCACGQRQSVQRQQARTVRTLIGPIRYVRPYYYCRACGSGRAPLDVALGQDARDALATNIVWLYGGFAGSAALLVNAG